MQHVLAESFEHAGRFGAQVFGAGLFSRKPGAVEQQHARPRARQQQGRGRSCRARADDDSIPTRGAQAKRTVRATTAPLRVAARFTASLSIHRTFPCTVAPSRESASMPTMPATATPAVNQPGCANPASTAINPAPATPPIVPRSVIPPSVPAETERPLVIRRGGVRECLPISLAQVSAVAAARAPANPGQLPASAARAATPPFARTCRSFRVVDSDNKLPDTKKARSSSKPRQPNPYIVATPTASAAAAPRPVSHLTRRTARAARAS